MFEEFSNGYYLGRLYVEPREVDGEPEPPAIQREQHQQVNERLYASGDGIERLDAPLVMKLGRTHFPVMGDESVPSNTLSIPTDFVDDETCDPPSLCEVFLAKAERAEQLLRTAGWHPDRSATA